MTAKTKTNKKSAQGVVSKNDAEAVAARERVLSMIDAISAEDLIKSIKRAPSLRGMILGYIAEEMFEKHLFDEYKISPDNIQTHDDHDRGVNKSDRTVKYGGRVYGIQLKSMQTNSIGKNTITQALQADIQNDASDARTVILPNGSRVMTTCYKRGEYDILAVPLFPFTGKWNFAYKKNVDCRATTSKKYTEYQAKYLLASTEKITWPLSKEWSTDLRIIMTDLIGSIISS